MELNGAALNVNKPCVTLRKTAFPKDNKVENAENEYPEKLWLPNLVFINLLLSESFIICEPRKNPKLKYCHLWVLHIRVIRVHIYKIIINNDKVTTLSHVRELY